MHVYQIKWNLHAGIVYCNAACDCGLFAVAFATAVVFGEHPGLLFFENTFIIIRNDVL